MVGHRCWLLILEASRAVPGRLILAAPDSSQQMHWSLQAAARMAVVLVRLVDAGRVSAMMKAGQRLLWRLLALRVFWNPRLAPPLVLLLLLLLMVVSGEAR